MSNEHGHVNNNDYLQTKPMDQTAEKTSVIMTSRRQLDNLTSVNEINNYIPVIRGLRNFKLTDNIQNGSTSTEIDSFSANSPLVTIYNPFPSNNNENGNEIVYEPKELKIEQTDKTNLRHNNNNSNHEYESDNEPEATDVYPNIDTANTTQSVTYSDNPISYVPEENNIYVNNFNSNYALFSTDNLKSNMTTQLKPDEPNHINIPSITSSKIWHTTSLLDHATAAATAAAAAATTSTSANTNNTDQVISKSNHKPKSRSHFFIWFTSF